MSLKKKHPTHISGWCIHTTEAPGPMPAPTGSIKQSNMHVNSHQKPKLLRVRFAPPGKPTQCMPTALPTCMQHRIRWRRIVRGPCGRTEQRRFRQISLVLATKPLPFVTCEVPTESNGASKREGGIQGTQDGVGTAPLQPFFEHTTAYHLPVRTCCTCARGTKICRQYTCSVPFKIAATLLSKQARQTLQLSFVPTKCMRPQPSTRLVRTLLKLLRTRRRDLSYQSMGACAQHPSLPQAEAPRELFAVLWCLAAQISLVSSHVFTTNIYQTVQVLK